MRKIFIDAGANDGCSVRKFREKFDLANEYEIFSFEIDPEFSCCFIGISNHTFINKAVWINDGQAEFYRSKAKYRDGGTLIKSKKTGQLDKKHPIVVSTVDFSGWISKNFFSTDYIILKMDIEGAEYNVINKMIGDGTIEYINRLLIEWHPKKIGLSTKIHKELISKLNMPMESWCALGWSKI